MRLIDADELLRQFNNSEFGKAVKSVIDDAPTITTGPVRRGQWIDHRNGIKCSRCGRSLELQYTDGVPVSWMEHCPNCGVEME